VDALVKALAEYEGTIVFISHDIYFVQSVANIVYEVKSGRVRKFSGSFDYYLEKKDKGEIYTLALPPAKKTEHLKKDEHAERLKSEALLRKEEEKKRKEQNKQIKDRIAGLNAEKDKLNLECSAKKRAIENPRGYRDNQDLEEYLLRVQEIEERTREITKEIVNLKKQIIK